MYPISSNTLDIMADIDDVIFRWAGGVHERCREAGLTTLPTHRRWAMWEDYDVPDKAAWIEVVDKAAKDGFYLTEPPIEEAVVALRALYFAGHRIHLVTARGFMANAENIRHWTKQWLEDYAIPHDTLTFAQDKVKAQAELGLRFDFAIDDREKNYEALRADGVKAYLLDAPHNQEATTPHRVYSVAEFADLVHAHSLEVAGA